MTPRQERFIAAYVANPNATQAAIQAGYSERSAHVTGHDLLKNPKVRQEIDAAQRGIVEDSLGSARWIVQQAVEIVGDAREAKQYGPANQALSLLAKRHPEFREGSQTTEQHLHLHGLTVEELRRLASGD